MRITLELPDEYLAFLPDKESEIAEVITAGLRARKSRIQHETDDLYSVLEVLSGFPDPAEVMALRASPRVVERSLILMEKRQSGGLSEDEEAEWDSIMRVEHLVRIAKAKALLKMRETPGAA